MTDIGVVEVIVGCFNFLFEADADTDPSCEFFNFDSPRRFHACVVNKILLDRGCSMSKNRCPLDSMPDCSAILSVILILAPFKVSLHLAS